MRGSKPLADIEIAAFEATLPKMNVFRRLPFKFDRDRLKEESVRLAHRVGFHSIANQISLTHRPGVSERYFDGIGSLTGTGTKEVEFSEFNGELEGSYLGHVYKTLNGLSPVPIVRMRLMRMLPKTCYSMHVDDSPRIHIPIVSNRQSFLVFQEHGAFHLPADGSTYWVNTMQSHSAMNGDENEARIHLLFSVCTTEFDTMFQF